MNKNKYLRIYSARRRLLIASAAWPTLGWAGAVRAQVKPPILIGWLNAGARDLALDVLNGFNEGMAALGWKAGAQYVLEERWADGRTERLPALAQEIAAMKPAIVVASSANVARTAAKAAPMTPIVFAAGDPISTGLVKSLARPGGMITGVSNVSADINAKLVELLVESLPKLRRVGFLADATSPNHGANVSIARRAAERYRIEAHVADVVKPEEIEPALARLAKDKVQALVLFSSPWISTYRQPILKFALAQRWPVVGGVNTYAEQGALFSYGADRAALSRRSAYYVDRILKGAKPSDLPIEQPTVFEMVINMKTAKALGITFPQTILVRATRVIE